MLEVGGFRARCVAVVESARAAGNLMCAARRAREQRRHMKEVSIFGNNEGGGLG